MPPPDLCCLHPTRPFSPLEPARPSPLTLDGIFAQAALPTDHPHALKLPNNNLTLKTSLTKKLTRSPSIATKLRGQLRRRATIRSLKAEVYDEDARQMTSEEVLVAAGCCAAGARSKGLRRRLGTGDWMRAAGVGGEGGGGEGEGPPTLRLRELSSLDVSNELRRFGTLSPPGTVRRARSSFVLGSAAAAAAAGEERPMSFGSGDVELRDLAYLNLDLAAYQLDGVTGARVDELGEDDGGVVANGGADQDVVDHDAGADVSVEVDADVDVDEPSAPHAVVKPDHDLEQDEDNNPTERTDSHASFHLSKRHISQQLRSMSQLSGPSDESERLTPDAWTFHRRERSGCFALGSNVDSTRSRQVHNTSESGVDSAHVPTHRGQVNKDPDASSSIYSRPTSPEMPEPYAIPADLAAVADWPLKKESPVVVNEQPGDVDKAPSCHSITDEAAHITIIEPALPTISATSPTPTILLPRVDSQSEFSGRAPSHKSGSSSTTKRSRFFERFSPPKKLVTKRRSIFKFLRAGSRHQTRSITTPALYSPRLAPCVDGPADDNELLTVQYELTVPESNPTRSVSLNNLPVPAVIESEGVASSPDLRRKPSLLEYERHLSVVGDNRRRPSTKDLNRLSQIEEDDRHEHVSTKRHLSYHSKIQDTDPLMEAALERQLREKAMFRSPSKRSIPFSETSSLSFAATSWHEPSTAQPQSPERDPLDIAGKKPIAAHLSPPLTPIDGRSRDSSFSHQRATASKKPMILHTPSSISRASLRSKIGSSLDSWSRYPSHTRNNRCASAGLADNVRTLDFALDIKHERIRGTDESDPFNPGKRVRTEQSTKSSKKPLRKSRSATFGTFVRYYSSLLSSPDFHGKGRRTSVAVGGRLDRPELEMLSPALPGSPTNSHVYELDELRPAQAAHTREQNSGEGKKQKSPLSPNHHLKVSDEPTSRPINFRGDSMFKTQASELQKEGENNATAEEGTQPDDSDDYFSARMGSSQFSSVNGKAELSPHLDGTVETTNLTTNPNEGPTPSKAQAWCEAYQDCLVVPPSPAVNPTTTATPATSNSMQPPTLKPTKHRSPSQQASQQSSLDPGAAVRRFPSVTVVDDRKGHWRSVSFISVKSVKSAGSAGSFLRESSNDLLRLMEAREREEREKLLGVMV